MCYNTSEKTCLQGFSSVVFHRERTCESKRLLKKGEGAEACARRYNISETLLTQSENYVFHGFLQKAVRNLKQIAKMFANTTDCAFLLVLQYERKT